MTLVEHLGELRPRLIIAVGAVAVGAIAAYILYNPILHVLRRARSARPCAVIDRAHHVHPACPNLYVTTRLAGFTLRLDIAGYGGLLIAPPVLFFQLWRFVTPGLKANEKRYAFPSSSRRSLLFALGAFVAWLTSSRTPSAS